MTLTNSTTGTSVGVIIVPVELTDPPDWNLGPLPVSSSKVTATDPVRRTYFHERTAKSLYGDEDHRLRFHRLPAPDETLDGCPVLGVELLRVQDTVQPALALLMIHLNLGDLPVEAASRLRWLSGGQFACGTTPESLTDGSCRAADDRTRATIVSFVSFPDGIPSSPFGDDCRWSDLEQSLVQMATATPASEFPPDPQANPPKTLFLSRSWRGLVMREGVAFLAQQPDDGTDPFLADGSAELHLRSIYVDAVLLGLIQRTSLHELAEQLATRQPEVPRLEHLREIETRLDDFRVALWGQHVTPHGPANELLLDYQAQHRLPELLAQIVGDLNDSARLHGAIGGERAARSLDLITKVGLPAGAVLALTPVWIEFGALNAAAALLIAMIAGFGFLVMMER
jgi:hypothetical protein